MAEETAGTSIKVLESCTIPRFIEHYISYNYSLSALLEIFAGNQLLEIRQACIDRLNILFSSDNFYHDHSTLDKLEDVIRQLFDLSIHNKFAQSLLGMYVFCHNKERNMRAIKFAVSLLSKDKVSFLILSPVSKVVCSRLNDYRPDDCYDENGELKVSIYEVLPEIREMLQRMLNYIIRPYELNELTKDRPCKCSNFCLAERALKVIVNYRRHDQSFLPQIEELIRLHQDGLLIFDVPPLESAKNVAVLKEAAKLLRQAQKKAQKRAL